MAEAMTKTVYRIRPKDRVQILINEGRRLSAYECTAGVWTIGPGVASTSGIVVRGMRNGEFYEGRVVKGLTITGEECDRLFDLVVSDVEEELSAALKHDPTPGQYAAMVDFCYQYSVERAVNHAGWLSKFNFNPSYGLKYPGPENILLWMRVGGEPDDGVYFRRLRNCVQWMGHDVPGWMHDPERFHFTLDAGGEIDFSETTSLHEVLGAINSETPLQKKAEPEPVEDVLFEPKPQAPAASGPAVEREEPAPLPSQQVPPAGPVVSLPEAPEEAKDMVLSRRFWGLLVTAIGSSHLIPEAIGNWSRENQELLTWVIVVGAGYALHRYGAFKASRPLK